MQLKKTRKIKLNFSNLLLKNINDGFNNDVKKFLYKPSPRMEMFKLKKLSKKFKSFSKDKKFENEFHPLNEISKPPINNSNNNSNNLTSNSINKVQLDQPKCIQTLRKSIVENIENTNKRNPSMNNIKPIVFKKLTKNINGKLSIFNSKLKRCESQSSASNIRTYENI